MDFSWWKVRDLEGDLDNTRRKSREVLQQAVSVERDRVTSLQWELEECRATLMNLEESSQSGKVSLSCYDLNDFRRHFCELLYFTCFSFKKICLSGPVTDGKHLTSLVAQLCYMMWS